MLNLNRANLSIDPLNESVNARIEQASLLKHASDVPRDYLGASLIGETCLRKQQFEWLTSATFSARVRSIFASGHYFEAESREQLREAGFVFAPIKTLGFVVPGSPIAGHADGVIFTVPDDIDLLTPALWEHKALNAKNFKAVERDGLAKVFPRYAGQVAIYQHFLEVFNPALMTIVNSDTCERLHFTVPFDPRLAQETIDRAIDVVRATRAGELLPRLDPELKDFRCEMCAHLSRCRRMMKDVLAMSEKLDPVMPKLVQLLLMLGSSSDGECLNAARATLRLLISIDADMHDLVDQLQNSKLTAAEVQAIYDKGFADGHSKGAEQGRRSAVIATARPMSVLDTSDVGPGVNGYGWFEIAQHCAAHKDWIYRDKDREFVDSVYEQIAFRGKPPTPPQAKWLRDIFNQRFGGRI